MYLYRMWKSRISCFLPLTPPVAARFSPWSSPYQPLSDSRPLKAGDPSVVTSSNMEARFPFYLISASCHSANLSGVLFFYISTFLSFLKPCWSYISYILSFGCFMTFSQLALYVFLLSFTHYTAHNRNATQTALNIKGFIGLGNWKIEVRVGSGWSWDLLIVKNPFHYYLMN